MFVLFETIICRVALWAEKANFWTKLKNKKYPIFLKFSIVVKKGPIFYIRLYKTSLYFNGVTNFFLLQDILQLFIKLQTMVETDFHTLI